MNERDTRLGTVLTLREGTETVGNWRLTEPLGGGLKAQVYRGVDVDEPATQVAVKITAREGGDLEAFRQELHTLLDLQRAEEDQQPPTHYFPRVVFPPRPDDRLMEQTIAGQPQIVLLLELLEPREWWPLSEVLMDQDDRRLPEPLALAIAEQYAHMLDILHGANKTCADRKLDDLRWQAAVKPDDPTWLDTDEKPGQLIVLDWNVVDEGPAGRRLDMFRFGMLWHRLLLGVEPRFQRPERGQGSPEEQHWLLIGRLEDQPGWDNLSHGTQEILHRALHPYPRYRYQRAEDLRRDAAAQLERWRQTVRDLAGAAEGRRPSFVQRILRREGKPRELSIQERFAAADVARLKATRLREALPRAFDRVYDGLKSQLISEAERQLSEIGARLRRGDWQVKADLSRVASQLDKQPQLALRAWRYDVLADAYRVTLETLRRTRDPSLSQRLGDEALRHKLVRAIEEGIENPRELEQSVGPSFQKLRVEDNVLTRGLRPLFNEAELRLLVRGADGLTEKGRFQDALTQYDQAVDLWDRIPLEARRHLAVLLQDPHEARRACAEKTRLTGELPDLIRSGLLAVERGNFDEAEVAFLAGLRIDPSDAALGEALRLARLRQRVAEAKEAETFDLRLLVLKQMLDVPTGGLGALRVKAESEGDRELASRLDSFVGYAQAEQERLRNELLIQTGRPVTGPLAQEAPQPQVDEAAEEQPDKAPPHEDATWRMLRAYTLAFPRDTDFLNALEKVLTDCQSTVREWLLPWPQVEDRSGRLWPTAPVPGPSLAYREGLLRQAYGLAWRGVGLARLLRERLGSTAPAWSSDLSPKRVERQLKGVQAWWEVWRETEKVWCKALEGKNMKLASKVVDLAKEYKLELFDEAVLNLETLSQILSQQVQEAENLNQAEKVYLNALTAESDEKAETVIGQAKSQVEGVLERLRHTEEELKDADPLLEAAVAGQRLRAEALLTQLQGWYWQRFIEEAVDFKESASLKLGDAQARHHLERARDMMTELGGSHWHERAQLQLQEMEQLRDSAPARAVWTQLDVTDYWLERSETYLSDEDPNPLLTLECAGMAQAWLKKARDSAVAEATQGNEWRQMEGIEVQVQERQKRLDDLFTQARQGLRTWQRKALTEVNQEWAGLNEEQKQQRKQEFLGRLDAMLAWGEPADYGSLDAGLLLAWQERHKRRCVAIERYEQARGLSRRERPEDWQEIERLLGEAVDLYPESSAIRDFQNEMEQRWRDKKAKLGEWYNKWQKASKELETYWQKVQKSLAEGWSDEDSLSLGRKALDSLRNALQAAEAVQPRPPGWDDRLKEMRHEIGDLEELWTETKEVSQDFRAAEVQLKELARQWATEWRSHLQKDNKAAKDWLVELVDRTEQFVDKAPPVLVQSNQDTLQEHVESCLTTLLQREETLWIPVVLARLLPVWEKLGGMRTASTAKPLTPTGQGERGPREVSRRAEKVTPPDIGQDRPGAEPPAEASHDITGGPKSSSTEPSSTALPSSEGKKKGYSGAADMVEGTRDRGVGLRALPCVFPLTVNRGGLTRLSPQGHVRGIRPLWAR